MLHYDALERAQLFFYVAGFITFTAASLFFAVGAYIGDLIWLAERQGA